MCFRCLSFADLKGYDLRVDRTIRGIWQMLFMNNVPLVKHKQRRNLQNMYIQIPHNCDFYLQSFAEEMYYETRRIDYLLMNSEG